MVKTHKTHSVNPQSNVKDHRKRKRTGKYAPAIIQMKLNSPHMSLKDISVNLNCTYDYTREVWSKYLKKEISMKGEPTERGGPSLPVHVHAWFFWNHAPTSWYGLCPVSVSENRNRQKVFQDRFFTFVIYPSGFVVVYPNFPKLERRWLDGLVDWLTSWGEGDSERARRAFANLFVDSLQKVGKKHFAFHTPEISPKKFCVNVKGVGKFKADQTPWPDGTLEFEVDPSGERSISQLREDFEFVRQGGLDNRAMMSRLETNYLKLTKDIDVLVEELRVAKRPFWRKFLDWVNVKIGYK